MPYRDAFKLNAWAIATVAVAFLARRWLGRHEPSETARLLVALAPLVPALLYFTALRRWLLGLDELHARLQLQALCLGALGALGAIASVEMLQEAGFFRAWRGGWEACWALTFLGYAAALTWLNRGYR